MARERITFLLAAGVLAATAAGAAAKSGVDVLTASGDVRAGEPVTLHAVVGVETVGPGPAFVHGGHPLAHARPVLLARRLGSTERARFRARIPTDSGGGTEITAR